MADNIIERFLTELGVQHTHKFIEDFMYKQPFSNSLHSFSALLDKYKITNEIKYLGSVAHRDKSARSLYRESNARSRLEIPYHDL